MALHNGVDLVSVVTRGFFSYTYGSADADSNMDLYASWGLFEDVPSAAGGRRGKWLVMIFKKLFRRA